MLQVLSSITLRRRSLAPTWPSLRQMNRGAVPCVQVALALRALDFLALLLRELVPCLLLRVLYLLLLPQVLVASCSPARERLWPRLPRGTQADGVTGIEY